MQLIKQKLNNRVQRKKKVPLKLLIAPKIAKLAKHTRAFQTYHQLTLFIYLFCCEVGFFAAPVLKANQQQVPVSEPAPSGWAQTTKQGKKEASPCWVGESRRNLYLPNKVLSMQP